MPFPGHCPISGKLAWKPWTPNASGACTVSTLYGHEGYPGVETETPLIQNRQALACAELSRAVGAPATEGNLSIFVLHYFGKSLNSAYNWLPERAAFNVAALHNVSLVDTTTT